MAGVPGGVLGGPRTYLDQFRGFKSDRVRTRTRMGITIELRKARKRELAAFDEYRRAVGMLNPMRDKK